MAAIVLLTDAEARGDLALTRTQGEAIDGIVAAGRRRDDELFEGIDRLNTDHGESPPFSTSREEWDEREAFAVGMLDPGQRNRLRALQLQSLGFFALFDADLQKELGLGPAQVAALERADDAHDARRSEAMAALFPRTTKANMERAFARLREQGEAETLAILTPEQRKAYRKRLGKPLKTTTDFGLMRV